jgi:hypothetical protein
MRTINVDDLQSDLHKMGVDERLTRGLLELARHVNSALEDMKYDVEDIADDRIQRACDRDNYWSSYDR